MNSQSTNIWDYKPAWCQPWSIILTGIVVIMASWLVLHTLWVTFGVGVAIAVWWIYFLVVYPKAFAEYMATELNKTN